ncbi:Hypothetical protein A7982_06231 [Minicystis rosea]|nr:Hypothetical protein A7982_06231 [Minicystis rosea]
MGASLAGAAAVTGRSEQGVRCVHGSRCGVVGGLQRVGVGPGRLLGPLAGARGCLCLRMPSLLADAVVACGCRRCLRMPSLLWGCVKGRRPAPEEPAFVHRSSNLRAESAKGRCFARVVRSVGAPLSFAQRGRGREPSPGT